MSEYRNSRQRRQENTPPSWESNRLGKIALAGAIATAVLGLGAYNICVPDANAPGQAAEQALRDPNALVQTGTCAAELQATEHYKNYPDRSYGAGWPKGEAYAKAAALATQYNAPCTPPEGSDGSYTVHVNGTAVTITGKDLTGRNSVETICGNPYVAHRLGNVAADIRGQNPDYSVDVRALLPIAKQYCPEATGF